MMDWGYGSGWGYLFMGVSMVVFWGLVIGAIVLIVRTLSRDTAAKPPAGPDPQQILAQRFARGEIDEAEYRSRLAALTGTPTAPR